MRKSTLLTLLFLLSNFITYSQVVFSEDFTDFTDNWADHPEWKDVDGDGLPAGEYFDYAGNIWVHPGWRVSPSWNCAMSNSRFTSPGKANNWMILPQVQLPNNTPYISWKSKSVSSSGNRQEDYEILISTSTNDTSDFVLLETVLQESYNYVNHSINLSAYAGQDVYIAFRHISYDEYLLCVTDIEMGGSSANDIQLSEIDVKDVCLSPSQIDIKGMISNLSSDEITSLDINWSINGGTTHTDNLTSLSIDPFTGVYNFTHSVQADITDVDLYNLKVWVSNPNGIIDSNLSNDTLSTTISGLSLIPEKNVLIEEGTGTWCSNCPDGAAEIESILNSTTNILAVALHSSDAMSTDESDEVLSEYFIAYPRAAIDRIKFDDWGEVAISRNVWQTKCNIRKNAIVPADIDITSNFNPSTRILDISVTSNFYTVMNKEYRLNAFVLENEIPGGSSAGQGYEQSGADDTYIHQHVLRAMLGGAWGTENSVSATTVDNGTYSHTYNFLLPNDYNFDNIHVYGIIQRYSSDVNDREIVNSKESTITTNINQISKDEIDINIYPNPCNEFINITANFEKPQSVNLKIYDINSRLIKTKQINVQSGDNLIKLNLNNIKQGTYFIEINTGNTSYIRKISVK